MAKDSSLLQSIGKELKNNPPKVLTATRNKYGVARAARQKTAILLSKARKAGASIPVKGAK